VVSSTPRPHFTPGKDPVPILQEAWWAPGPVWTGGKSRPHRDSIPDSPARISVAIPTELPGHNDDDVVDDDDDNNNNNNNNSLEQSTSLDGQRIPGLVRNRNIQYHVHYSLPTDSILRQINAVHAPILFLEDPLY